jgi:hypothetical protein
MVGNGQMGPCVSRLSKRTKNERSPW